ncbi:MAG: nicotinamide riboside transporter PnuC [Bacteroidota bacterium]|nr:nicotinamide riboside transporter PnuC [Bacteroidota bacterium]
MISWIIANWVELTGTILGFIYVWFEIKGHIWLWPVGILMSAFYIYIFFMSKLYADMGLQFYYLVVSIYGWLIWLSGKSKETGKDLPISKLKLPMAGKLIMITIPLYALLAFILVKCTDSPVPYCDAFPTTLSIIATYMLARKILEQWSVLIVVNICSTALYLYRGLNPTALLYGVYIILSVIGYFQWKKEMKLMSAETLYV